MIRPLRHTWLITGLLLVIGALPSCQDAVVPLGQQPAETQAVQGLAGLPRGPIAGHPWATQPCPTAPLPAGVLACVDGVAITRERFDQAQREHPPGTAARATLQALIDEEVLAQAAAAGNLWTAWLAPLQRRAMVARLLQRTQEDALPPAKVSAVDVQTAYKNPNIRLRFDHAAGYFATDVQLLCCKGDWRQCEKREEVRACIDKTASQAHALHRLLAADPPRSSAELKSRVALLVPQFPLVAVQDVEFWYDKSKSYAQQKGYDLMVEQFAVPVVEMQPGELAQPIRTPFGWHLPRLTRIEPEMHKPWHDPAVRSDIAEHIVDAVREREVQRYAFGLLAKYKVQFFFDKL